MKNLGLALLLAYSLAGCTPTADPAPSATSPATPIPAATTTATATPGQSPASDTEFVIKPEVGFGPIGVTSTKESLAKEFGADNVRQETIYVGDGMEWPGLAVYPDDPEKRVEVFWWEEDPTRVQLVRIQGESSLWKTAEGVSLGTTLSELESLNGKPFELLGLAWDFGGGVTNWNGGKLEGLTLRLDASPEASYTDEEASQILGDQQVSSDNLVMRKVNPAVFQITVSFPMQ